MELKQKFRMEAEQRGFPSEAIEELCADALTEIERLEKINKQLEKINKQYEKVLADTQRVPHGIARIATALEQAAVKGWGNVFSESLLPDEPTSPGEDS